MFDGIYTLPLPQWTVKNKVKRNSNPDVDLHENLELDLPSELKNHPRFKVKRSSVPNFQFPWSKEKDKEKKEKEKDKKPTSIPDLLRQNLEKGKRHSIHSIPTIQLPWGRDKNTKRNSVPNLQIPPVLIKRKIYEKRSSVPNLQLPKGWVDRVKRNSIPNIFASHSKNSSSDHLPEDETDDEEDDVFCNIPTAEQLLANVNHEDEDDEENDEDEDEYDEEEALIEEEELKEEEEDEEEEVLIEVKLNEEDEEAGESEVVVDLPVSLNQAERSLEELKLWVLDQDEDEVEDMIVKRSLCQIQDYMIQRRMSSHN